MLPICEKMMPKKKESNASLLFGLSRWAVTGRVASPPLFQTMAVLGKERCLKRISDAVAFLRGDK